MGDDDFTESQSLVPMERLNGEGAKISSFFVSHTGGI
jgi:hypothetical protein